MTAIASSADSGRRLGSVVYDVIKERLLDGRWQAGEQVSVEPLKTELGVSKQPVMEALRRLAVDGLVEIIPQVGCRVPVYGASDAADFFTLFASLEAEATAIAAGRGTEAQLGRLVDVNARIGEVSTRSDPTERVRGYRSLNREFHMTILEMAHSPVVVRHSSRMWDISDLLITASGRALPLAQEVGERHAEHDHLIDALRQHDVERAREQMRQHVLRNISMLERA